MWFNMKNMKTKLIALLVFTSLRSVAQQDAQYTQYMYNTVSVNPAYAGTREQLSFLALHRSQWIGLDGAPVTNTFAANTPLGDSKLGLGFSVINDKIGPIVSNSLSVDLSYTIDLNDAYKLSFGLKGTANFLKLDANRLNMFDKDDQQITSISNSFSPNFGSGIYLHSNKGYVGTSIRNLVRTVTSSNVALHKEELNYYLIGGYVFDIDYALQFKPAILVKAVKGAPLQADISANFLFSEKFTVGAAYRWSAAVSAMAGFQVSEKLFIGYGYDFDTTSLGRFNSGSHEVFVRFELPKAAARITAPRFF